MRRFTIELLILLSFCLVVAAQSGRRVKSAPPAPPPKTEDSSDDYSESKPNPARTVYSQPTTRGTKNKTKDKPETVNSNQTLQGVKTTTEAPAGEDEVLKVDTNLVTIPVSVYERSGVYVPNLRQSDFKIFEDGAEQEIAYFGSSDKPFSVILLIDVSPSTAYKIEEIQNAARSFVNQLKPEDRVMVIEFDSRVNVLTELTNDREKINQAIGRTGFGSGTSLYEAVNFSLRKRLNKIDGRKAIVLFTDGVDTTSGMGSGFEKTIREAEESDSIIFPVYYNTFFEMTGIGRGGVMSAPAILGLPGGMNSEISSAYVRGRAYLEGLAGATGGRVFRPESTTGGLTAAFEGIAEELRRQYSIGYYPQSEGQAGQRKTIKVRVNRPGVAVQARDSYIVGTPGSAARTSK